MPTPPPGLTAGATGFRVTEGPGAGALVAPMPSGDGKVVPPTTVAGGGMSAMPVRPSGSDPDVVAPQERGRARRTMPKSAPSRELQPGDLVCGSCGEANLPTRRFCSRCGNELEGAEVVKAPWWRRILPKRKPREARAVEPDTGIAKDRPAPPAQEIDLPGDPSFRRGCGDLGGFAVRGRARRA
jgi:hypothetical protein